MFNSAKSEENVGTHYDATKDQKLTTKQYSLKTRTT